MIRPILTWPDLRLRQASKRVTRFDTNLRLLVRDLIETMQHANGAGLAAPQIGVFLRVFVLDPSVIASVSGDTGDPEPLVYVNPSFLHLSLETTIEDEGCLSFPGVFVPVARSGRCQMHGRDAHGNEVKITANGLHARALQHEYDHLVGTLLIDREISRKASST